MDQVKAQIYSGMWVRLPYGVKDRIATLFKIEKRGITHVVDGQVQSDGYLDNDLAILNVPNLQKLLDSDETDLFILFNTLVNNITLDLSSKKEEIKIETDNIQIDIKIDGEDVKLTGKKASKTNKKK